MPHAGDSRAPQIPAGNTSPTLMVEDNGADTQGTFGGFNCEAFTSANVGAVRQARTRRGVADTSAEAFHSLSPRDYLAPKELAILALFTGPDVRLSRQQIAQAVPMLINGVCGRVDSLLSSKHLEECKERRRDPVTGKSQKLLQLPRSEQGDLVERGA